MNNQNTIIQPEIIAQVKVHKLDAIIAENSHLLIDVREPSGIASQGAIPGAVNIPFHMIENAIDKNSTDYHELFNEGHKPMLFCCTGGVMSYMAALKVQKRGYKQLYNLEGGHSAWLKHKKTTL